MHNVPHIKDLVAGPLSLSVTPRMCSLAQNLIACKCILLVIPSYCIHSGCFPLFAQPCYWYRGGCPYVRCLMVDFSKAFDRVDHRTLLT